MSVDREQIRRDVDYARSGLPNYGYTCAGHCLTLLAELEQAERRSEGIDPDLFTTVCFERDQAQADLREASREWLALVQELVETLRAAEARLAKVPPLVEALKQIERWADEAEEGWHPGGVAGDALADWEAKG